MNDHHNMQTSNESDSEEDKMSAKDFNEKHLPNKRQKTGSDSFNYIKENQSGIFNSLK